MLMCFFLIAIVVALASFAVLYYRAFFQRIPSYDTWFVMTIFVGFVFIIQACLMLYLQDRLQVREVDHREWFTICAALFPILCIPPIAKVEGNGK